MLKELIRRCLWPFAVLGLSWVFTAKEGSAWFRFLTWLYGEDECFADSPIDMWFP